MDDTHFVNVHGRDPADMTDTLDCPDYEAFDRADCAHYSTARDLTVLLDKTLEHPLLHDILGTRAVTTGGMPFQSTNALLPGGDFSLNEISPGVVYAGKTGTTQQAGWCFVGAARDLDWDHQVIMALMGLPRDMAPHERWNRGRILFDTALVAAEE